MSDLIVARIDKAKLLLAEARDATDAKKIMDMAKAAEIYAKRQRLSEDVINYATTVKVDSKTLMGEFLDGTPKANGGHAQRTRLHKGTESPPTLEEVGISKRESSEAQARGIPLAQ